MTDLSGIGVDAGFQNRIKGLYGTFVTPAGRVNYLIAKARLGDNSANDERRLTQHLVPVREVIPSKDLDFNQLLQRDLDDHRVAVGLIPYLLDPPVPGPAFFPPIVAVMLPFSAKKPSSFPELSQNSLVHDELHWEQQQADSAMRVRRLADPTGQLSPIPLGELAWNSEYSQLVVVDGQHRAMALLAIDRTTRNTWDSSSGRRFKYFYEDVVNAALKGKGASPLRDIEVPVTILWFPELFGSDKNPHIAARKIFVDVNKEARTPSESRLILLSDTELINIFVRTTLTQLRNVSDNDSLPLYAIEYDNPDTKSTQSARWSALANIHSIKQMVSRTVFGPGRYINRVDIAIGKREGRSERDAFMRQQLRVEQSFPAYIGDGSGFPRDEIGNKSFPEEILPKLTEIYANTWSRGIVILLSKLRFYAAHVSALNALHENWLNDDAIATLANDALFGGVGMYWTLRDSAAHWQQVKPSGSQSPKPDVVKSWDLVAAKQQEFEAGRSLVYMGSSSAVARSNAVYQTVNTHACQVGLALTLATLDQLAHGVAPVQVSELADRMAHGINSWINAKTSGSYDRRLIFVKNDQLSPKYPLNLIAQMDTPKSILFRYFWLEILSSQEGLDALGDAVDANVLHDLRDSARRLYIDYVANEKAKALRTTRPDLSSSQRAEQGAADACKVVSAALERWFTWYDGDTLKNWFALYTGLNVDDKSADGDDEIEEDFNSEELDNNGNLDA